MPIQDGKLLYHLTSLSNLESILQNGLKPRSQLTQFTDVADSDILVKRQSQNLQDFVPFHFFAKNPFDLAVQNTRKSESFVLITVRRDTAQQNDWQISPRHPLAVGNTALYSYDVGIQQIDWETMETRDYADTSCKSICMAECLSPDTVYESQFFKIYVPSAEISREVTSLMQNINVQVDVGINEYMFVKQDV